MKHLFQILHGIVVPDGSTVHEIVSPRQLNREGLRVNDGVSAALGDLPAGTRSSVHVHPIVWHFSWVVEGTLTVMMKDLESPDPYRLTVAANHGVLAEPGSFFQLINDGTSSCQVMYIVGPAFVFETADDGNVVYNDAIVLPHTWEELREQNWEPPECGKLEDIRIAREESLRRLAITN